MHKRLLSSTTRRIMRTTPVGFSFSSMFWLCGWGERETKTTSSDSSLDAMLEEQGIFWLH